MRTDRKSALFAVAALCVLLGAASALGMAQREATPEQESSPQKKTQPAQSSSLDQRVSALEAKMSQLTGIVIPDFENAMSAMVNSKAQSDSATIMVINRINSLQNKIKMLEDKAAYADSSNLEILQQLMMIENKIVTLTRSFNELYAMKTTPLPSSASRISSSEFKRRYVEALSSYQNGDFQKAIEGFSALVAADREHKLADNSQYWLGESYYSLKNYKRAILEFEKVFQFSEKDKWDDSQLKLGICYQRIGNLERAREEYQKLIDHYPDSEYYQKALQYLRQL